METIIKTITKEDLRAYAKRFFKAQQQKEKLEMKKDKCIKYLSKKFKDICFTYNKKYDIIVGDNGALVSYTGLRIKFIKHSLSKTGYCKFRHTTVHKVVWETFNGSVPKGLEIDHIDNDKENNSLSNLRVITHKDNIIHRDECSTIFGREIVVIDLKSGKIIDTVKSQKELCKKYEVVQCTASSILNHRYGFKSYHGYKFIYKDEYEMAQ